MDNDKLYADAPKPFWKRFLLPGILLGLGVGVYASGLYENFSYVAFLENRIALQRFVADNFIAGILIYIATYAALVALSLPFASFLTIISGFMFGWVFGGLAAVIGATLGATAIFLAAKTVFGSLLEKKAGPWIQKVGDGFRKDAFGYLLFLRLVPLFPFFATNIVPAFFNVSLRTYMATTFLGIIPGTFAFAFLGVGFDSVFAGHHEVYQACVATGAEDCTVSADLSGIVTPQLLMAFTLLGLAALIPMTLKKLKAKRKVAK